MSDKGCSHGDKKEMQIMLLSVIADVSDNHKVKC